jgi:hypothetical protein
MSVYMYLGHHPCLKLNANIPRVIVLHSYEANDVMSNYTHDRAIPFTGSQKGHENMIE